MGRRVVHGLVAGAVILAAGCGGETAATATTILATTSSAPTRTLPPT